MPLRTPIEHEIVSTRLVIRNCVQLRSNSYGWRHFLIVSHSATIFRRTIFIGMCMVNYWHHMTSLLLKELNSLRPELRLILEQQLPLVIVLCLLLLQVDTWSGVIRSAWAILCKWKNNTHCNCNISCMYTLWLPTTRIICRRCLIMRCQVQVQVHHQQCLMAEIITETHHPEVHLPHALHLNYAREIVNNYPHILWIIIPPQITF